VQKWVSRMKSLIQLLRKTRQADMGLPTSCSTLILGGEKYLKIDVFKLVICMLHTSKVTLNTEPALQSHDAQRFACFVDWAPPSSESPRILKSRKMGQP
jgi:hypothetical protein